MFTYPLVCVFNFMLVACEPNYDEVACSPYKVEQTFYWLMMRNTDRAF